MVAVLIEEGGAGRGGDTTRWHSSSRATLQRPGSCRGDAPPWLRGPLMERDLCHLLPCRIRAATPGRLEVTLQELEAAPGAVSPPASSSPAQRSPSVGSGQRSAAHQAA